MRLCSPANRLRTLVPCLSLVCVTMSTTMAEEPRKLLDLTHSFDKSTIYWPTEDGFKLIRESAGITEQGYYYAANRFMCAEHGGTHIDAPIDFFRKGRTVHKTALDRLIGPGACVDVVAKCASDRDYQVVAEDFEKWEPAH